MFDFGLKPCPLCGGEAEVARLTQNTEELTTVIKCRDCGLTLDWATEYEVRHSRSSGQSFRVKVGLDPIEAWNQRRICENCGEKCLAEQVMELPSCNDCGDKDCEYKPRPGQHARINCPLWRPMEGEL